MSLSEEDKASMAEAARKLRELAEQRKAWEEEEARRAAADPEENPS